MKAIDVVRQAIQLDAQGRLEDAAKAYRCAFEELSALLAAEKNVASRRELVETNFRQFLDRAEEIDEFITAQRSQTEDAKFCQVSADFALLSKLQKEQEAQLWDTIKGLERVKAFLQEQVILPIRFPAMFESKPKKWKATILYGPPGSGKTMLLRGLSDVLTSERCKVFLLFLEKLSTKAMDGQRIVHDSFREAYARAKKGLPSLILIDNLEVVCEGYSCKDQVCFLHQGKKYAIDPASAASIKEEILFAMRDLEPSFNGMFILGTSQRPWEIDPPLRRRFDRRLFCTLPDDKTKAELFHTLFPREAHQWQEEAKSILLDASQNCSAKEISESLEAVARCGADRLRTSPWLLQLDGFDEADEELGSLDVLQVPSNSLQIPGPTLVDFSVLSSRLKPVSPTLLARYDTAFQ